MRKVVIGVAGAALLAVSGGMAAAADQVRIWVPSPVNEVAHKPPHDKVHTEVFVTSLLVIGRPYRCQVSNEYGLDFRYGGCRTPFYPTRYPF